MSDSVRKFAMMVEVKIAKYWIRPGEPIVSDVAHKIRMVLLETLAEWEKTHDR